MTASAVRTQISARDVNPNVAIEIGYNLYLMDHCRQGSALAESARETVEHFNLICRTFPEDSPEAVYFMNLRLAANSLARGIARRKEVLRERTKAAEDEKANMVRRIAQTERLMGIMKGGFQILLLGGFGFFAMRTVFHMPSIEGQTQGMKKEYASLSFALFMALAGSFFKAQMMTRRIMKVFQKYNEAITAAHEEYVQAAIQEYRFAAETAELGWEQLTREKAPMTRGFQSLLIGIMGGDEADLEVEKINTAMAGSAGEPEPRPA